MRECKVSYSRNLIVRRVPISGAFKLDNLQTFKPHLIQNHANFFLIYWGANTYHPATGPTFRIGNSPHSGKFLLNKMISTAHKIHETEVLECPGQPNETVHSPFSQLYLYLNFSFDSDLNK